MGGKRFARITTSARHDITIDSFIYQIDRDVHQQIFHGGGGRRGGYWNAEWADFWAKHGDKAPESEIWAKADEMMSNFGFGREDLVEYVKRR